MSARGRSPLMDRLLALGEPEIKRNWLDCAELGIGPEHIEELIGLALAEKLYSAPSSSREVWVPVHAWRALGQLRAAEAAEPLTHLLGACRRTSVARNEMAVSLSNSYGHSTFPGL